MYNIQTGKRTLVTNQYTLTGNISYANDDYYFMAQKAGVDFIEALNSLCYIRIKSNNKIDYLGSALRNTEDSSKIESN